jgi:RNA polymerase sigma factor (sigma-70 family)
MMMEVTMNPLAEATGIDPDADLVTLAQSGSREALEELVARHQAWIYNIALRMIYLPQDAEDITQEILIKLITKLSTFEGRSRFRTWLYRLVVNHVLNMKRTKGEQLEWTFEKYGSGLQSAPDEELPDPNAVPVDLQLLVQEAKIGCTTGMLLCLSREQRLVYILGEIFGVTDVVGAELLEVSRDNFRQKLSRARRDLHQFMDGQCGLVNAANPCRCAKKTQAFIRAGYLDPHKLIFATSHVERVRDLAPKTHERLEALDAAYADIHREHPFQSGPDFVAALRRLIGGALAVALLFVVSGCGTARDDYSPDAIIALEKGALNRWGKGDPAGYFEIIGDAETYFDPTTEKRLDGLSALRQHIAPFTGKIRIDRVEMIDPKVQRVGDLAVLTFNLSDYGASIGDAPKSDARWNSTEVFQRIDGKWKIVHSHWSYVKSHPSVE